MLRNKHTKISLIIAYIILIPLTTYFIIVTELDSVMRTIVILITLIGPLIGLISAKLSMAIDRWRYSEAAFSIGIFISKYIAPLATIVFLVIALFAAFNKDIFYISYIAPVAFLTPFIGVIYDEIN